MFYSPMVKKASLIMFDAHKDDYDKNGYPYVMHPMFLATQMTSEAAVCVALLHDVIEDHGDRYSFEYLLSEGFPPEVVDALKLLTHEDGVPYLDYVALIGGNALARQVKIADLKHNLDASRMDGRVAPKRDLYLQALKLLEEIGEKV